MAGGTIRTGEATAEAAANDLLQTGGGLAQAKAVRLSSLAPVPGSSDHDGLAEAAEAASGELAELVRRDAKATVAADGALHVTDDMRAQVLEGN